MPNTLAAGEIHARKCQYREMTIRRGKLDVAVVLVSDGYASTAVGPIEVFSDAGTMWAEMCGDDPEPRFRVTTASIDGAPVRSAYGLNIAPDRAMVELGPVDLVMVSASGPVPEDWLARHAAIPPWLAERYRGGTRIAVVCSGVAFLAEAGLLAGRKATTHWGVADGFRQRYLDVDWQTDLLITEPLRAFLLSRRGERVREGAAPRHAATETVRLRPASPGAAARGQQSPGRRAAPH